MKVTGKATTTRELSTESVGHTKQHSGSLTPDGSILPLRRSTVASSPRPRSKEASPPPATRAESTPIASGGAGLAQTILAKLQQQVEASSQELLDTMHLIRMCRMCGCSPEQVAMVMFQSMASKAMQAHPQQRASKLEVERNSQGLLVVRGEPKSQDRMFAESLLEGLRQDVQSSQKMLQTALGAGR
jgi:hypothetical protein